MSLPLPSSSAPWGRAGPSVPDAVRVLLVEDNEEYARMVARTLDRVADCRFEVDCAERLDAALGRIEQRDYDVMLVDLGLPDGFGAFTLGSACALAGHLPVLVLTANDDEQLALAAVRSGAQEYLVKDRVDRRALAPTILRAIERHRRIERISAMRGSVPSSGDRPVRVATSDSVTGLPNEVILFDRLAQAIARAERAGGSLALMRLEHDQFLTFQALFGDGLTQQLLRSTAQRLGRVVRGSGTVARVGEGGFAVLLEDVLSREAVARMGGRLLDALDGEDMRDESGLQIAGVRASIGVAIYPNDGTDPETLLEHATAAHRMVLTLGGGRLRFHEEPRRGAVPPVSGDSG